MEIQWVMLAKEVRKNSDTTMCIDGIFHHLNNISPDKNVAMVLIVKLKPSITEVGEIKQIGIAIQHTEKGLVWIQKTPYKVHDVYSVLYEHPYMARRLLNVKFPYSGEYTFKVIVPKECEKEESIMVSLEEDK